MQIEGLWVYRGLSRGGSGLVVGKKPFNQVLSQRVIYEML